MATRTKSTKTKGRRPYKLISADGHLNEPGDLWTSRVPKKYKDVVPRIERFDEGDAWVIEGFPVPQPFGWGACAGLPPEKLNLWMRFEDLRRGSYDPVARVEEQDADGVDAEVLFGSGYPGNFVAGTKDPDLHLTMVQAYNDFLSEFCSHDPSRLGGAALLPNRGLDDCISEVKRLSDMPGIATFWLKCYPHGDTNLEDEDDPLWAAIEESGKPLTIHVGLSNDLPSVRPAKSLPGTGHFYDAPKRMLEFIFSGALDRFPDLTIFLAEVDCGWLPYFADQADDNYMRHSKAALKDVKLAMLPSEYMKTRFPAAFITDPYAIENRHRVGVERMLWSNDYPHIVSDWPYSWKTINATFANVPADERHAILAGNAQRIFPAFAG
jgi:predicted TIM-barrel fold metal-dependent hydrolase